MGEEEGTPPPVDIVATEPIVQPEPAADPATEDESTDDTAEANTSLLSPEIQLEIRQRELAVAGTIVIANATTEVRDRLRALPDRPAQEAFRQANPAQEALFMNRTIRTLKDGEFTGKGIVLTDTDDKPKYTVEGKGITKIIKCAGGILTCKVDGQDEPVEIPKGKLASIMMQTDAELILSNFTGTDQELVRRSIEQQKTPGGALTPELEDGLDALVLDVAKNNGILTMDNLRGFASKTVPPDKLDGVMAQLDALGVNLANPDAFNAILAGAGITIENMQQGLVVAQGRKAELIRLMGHKPGEIITENNVQRRVSDDDQEKWASDLAKEEALIAINSRIIETATTNGDLMENYSTRQLDGLVPVEQSRALAQYVETGDTENILSILVPEPPADAPDAEKKAASERRKQYDSYLRKVGMGAGLLALLVALGFVSGSKQ